MRIGRVSGYSTDFANTWGGGTRLGHELIFQQLNSILKPGFGTMRISVLINQAFGYIHSLGTTGWAIVGAILVTVGVICMRGYGSRDNY